MGETFGAEVTFEVMEWQELMRVEVESHDAIVVKDLSDLSDLSMPFGDELSFISHEFPMDYGLSKKESYGISGWWFQRCFIFHFIYYGIHFSQARDAS